MVARARYDRAVGAALAHHEFWALLRQIWVFSSRAVRRILNVRLVESEKRTMVYCGTPASGFLVGR